VVVAVVVVEPVPGVVLLPQAASEKKTRRRASEAFLKCMASLRIETISSSSRCRASIERHDRRH
jgi:hypothetical protein